MTSLKYYYYKFLLWMNKIDVKHFQKQLDNAKKSLDKNTSKINKIRGINDG